uniref:Uncharacterized protein n=1 Tax=Anopheles christyi TaxID=43041 RepID=A0A182JWQ5_9DIPT
MFAEMFFKVALLVGLLAMVSTNALLPDETTGAAVTPKIDVPKLSEDLLTTQTPLDDNNTTTTTTTTTSTTDATTTTTSTSTTPATTTPNSNTTTTTPATTTTPSSNTTTTSTTTPATPTPAPTPTPTTSTVAPSTTPAPTPVPHCNRFDPYSFVGGMILAYGSLAISLVLYKFYKTHTNAGAMTNANNYRTL